MPKLRKKRSYLTRGRFDVIWRRFVLTTVFGIIATCAFMVYKTSDDLQKIKEIQEFSENEFLHEQQIRSLPKDYFEKILDEHYENQEEELQYMSEFLTISTSFKIGLLNDPYTIILNNTGSRSIKFGVWALYFSKVGERINDIYEAQSGGICSFSIQHIEGTFHKLKVFNSNDCMKGIPAQKSVSFDIDPFTFGSYAELFSGWYAAFPNGKTTKRLKYHLSYGGDYSIPQIRFDRSYIVDLGEAPNRIIPSVKKSNLNFDQTIDISSWIVCSQARMFDNTLQTFTNLFNLRTQFGECPDQNFIFFSNVRSDSEDSEKYSIRIKDHSIIISSATERGGFYAVQTLHSYSQLLGGRIPTGSIHDEPRFSYRGLLIDPARNFIPKNEVVAIIELMAKYKLNKLHLHLTDDEGWRLAIPGLPQLTDYGAKRCHNTEECLSPQLGSGPDKNTRGSGFYTVSDYEEILRVAEMNRVEVIPEIDFPGHSNAAIKSMAQRKRKHNEDIKDEYGFVLQSDTMSSAPSLQNFKQNSLDPCIESSYEFIEYIVEEIVKIHANVQPLKKIHLGGDEVPKVDFELMPTCQRLFVSKFGTQDFNKTEVMTYYYNRIFQSVTSKYKISIVNWVEASFFFSKQMQNTETYVNIWKNSGLTTFLADQGFKVIISNADSLYLDHRHESDSSEIGLSWASTFINDRTLFDFTPDEFYLPESNESSNRHNVVGMEASLWGELIKDSNILHSQLFPRLLPFAERAWSKAEWEHELITADDLHQIREKDWEGFANLVGYHELKLLKMKNIKYRIPPPGVREVDNTLYANTIYPGFTILYQINGQWNLYNRHNPPKRNKDYSSKSSRITFKTVDGIRQSRLVHISPDKLQPLLEDDLDFSKTFT